MTHKPGAAFACVIALLAYSAARADPEQDYMLHCMGCHGTRAEGVPGKVPPLAGVLSRFMRTAQGRDYVLRVPGAANSALNDEQLAAVLNWLAVTYNGGAPAKSPVPFTGEEVSRSRHTPLVSVPAARSVVVRNLAATGAAPPAQY